MGNLIKIILTNKTCINRVIKFIIIQIKRIRVLKVKYNQLKENLNNTTYLGCQNKILIVK